MRDGWRRPHRTNAICARLSFADGYPLGLRAGKISDARSACGAPPKESRTRQAAVRAPSRLMSPASCPMALRFEGPRRVFRSILLNHRDEFVPDRGPKKLLTYALGRGVEF